jgi:hypothetical protein
LTTSDATVDQRAAVEYRSWWEVSGCNLDQLLPENGFNAAGALVGTEGTCALTLEGTVRLVPSPPKRTLAVLGYPTIPAGGYDVT